MNVIDRARTVVSRTLAALFLGSMVWGVFALGPLLGSIVGWSDGSWQGWVSDYLTPSGMAPLLIYSAFAWCFTGD